MMVLLLGMVMQTTPLPYETWKERNHPDMPVMPACDLGRNARVTDRMAKLPKNVSAELTRFFAPHVMSEADGPFNSTDVIAGDVPNRRFIRGYHIGSDWIIWYERGGRASGPRTIALNARNQQRTMMAQPGTIFAGNLCAATKAIANGVRTGAL